jgi:hypothetical protein
LLIGFLSSRIGNTGRKLALSATRNKGEKTRPNREARQFFLGTAPGLFYYKRNYPAAPHLAVIGPAHGQDVRFAVPLTATWGTAEQLRFGGLGHFRH